MRTHRDRDGETEREREREREERPIAVVPKRMSGDQHVSELAPGAGLRGFAVDPCQVVLIQNAFLHQPELWE